jgi:iron complex transport system substrate-binding protein
MPGASRIISFLPSATEMVCVLGLEEKLVGLTHECDYPGSINGKPVVVRSAIPVEQLSESEIDTAVSERMSAGLSVYQVDEVLLKSLAPDLILTQDLCQVCAPSGNEVTQALNALPNKPEILWLTPRTLAEIADNLREVARATATMERAETWIATNFERLKRIETRALQSPVRPRVFCMEWLDPLYCSGHWVPEMIRIAGGIDELSKQGSDSIRVSWQDVLNWSPEILILMPCGNHLEQVMDLAPKLCSLPQWKELPAVRRSKVYAVDASSYFARPGPRVIQGTELLAHLIHPELFGWEGPANAFRKIECN